MNADVESGLQQLLTGLQAQMKDQVTELLLKIGTISSEAYLEAQTVVKAISLVSQRLGNNEITKEAADHALSNYWESLRLIELRLETEQQKVAYRQAITGLKLLKETLLIAIQVGLTVAGAGQFAPLLQALARSILP